MAHLLSRIGAFSHRRRLALVLVWLAVLVAGGVGALTLAGTTTNSFSIPGQESTVAQERITEEFGAGGATVSVALATTDGATLADPEIATAVGELVGTLADLPGVAAVSDPLDPAAPAVNADLTIGYSTVTLEGLLEDVTEQQRDALLDVVEGAGTDALTVEASGEALSPGVPHMGIGEVIGVVLAMIVLAVTYGSLVAAGMNLLTAVVGVGVGVLGITIATGFLDLSSTTSALAGMLGLAVGIDYALFIISRYRQELLRGADVGTAIALAAGTAGSAVVTAGLTVVIALLGLSVVGIPFLTQMGVAAAGTIVVAVLVALTLVPAALSFVGVRALPRRTRAALAAGNRTVAPQDTERSSEATGFLARWVATVTRFRVATVLLTIAALGVLSIPFASMATTLVPNPEPDSTQARAQELLAEGFGDGINGPLVVLLEGEGASRAAAGVTESIASLPDVGLVVPPQPNADDTAALLTVIPESGPQSEATEQLVGDLRAELTGTDGVEAYVTGATAVSVDVAQSLDDALPVYLVLVVGLAFVLLVLVFRSLLVPLVGVLGFLLTVGASLGATVAVFQWGWLADLVGLTATGPLISLTPILVIGILFGLAMDYQVFLVSRMHEAHAHGAAPLAAIRDGFRRSAPVVVAAALIMFGVFAGFASSPDPTLKSIAFALAVGILVDAFVVRMVLVPAALALMGEHAWWLPRWLRWLPSLDVEGAALTAHRAGAAATAESTTGTEQPAVSGAR
ncbi:MMPL family transporter [Candidatus Blastococcus massiliensis]|uniref:MMPL family transporter n=1 Tax=Candidatus Blastococcus massiliensis TaxID=1470358 RepID=UPI0004B3041B|nr:MMPL family transporter [Candidatus Blastococcus massiliensis]